MAKKKGSQRKKTSAKKKSASSKKKGGSKKKQQKSQVPENPVVEEEPTNLVEQEPVEEPEASAEEKEAKVGDTVASVIGYDNKEKDVKEKKKSPTRQKREKLILQWTAEGYNTDELEELLESGAKKGVKKAFDEFEKAIVRIEVIKKEIDGLDTTGIEERVESFQELLKFPGRIDEINDEYAKMDGYRRIGELRAELDKMVLPQFKERVDGVREMLNVDNLESAEEAVQALKKDYKEAYFEEGVAASIVSKDDGPAVKKAAPASKPAGGHEPMNVRDIFLLYRNGKFISHHTGRVVPKEEQEQLFADLKTGRNYLKSPNYKPQKLNVISVNGRKILVQGGQFTVVVMIADGTVNPFTERIIAKVLGLMEKEDRVPLMNWNGDVSALKSAGKYMTALLYAAMKLGKKQA